MNGEAYDAIQRDIIVNHVAIGPKGWGRAGPDCAIRTDSNQTPKEGPSKMTEVVRLDGVDVALTAESIICFYAEKKRQFEELRGRFDAMGLELEKEKARLAVGNALDPCKIRLTKADRARIELLVTFCLFFRKSGAQNQGF
jgi:hypothetical protein